MEPISHPPPPPSNPVLRCSLALAPIPFLQERMVRWLEPWRKASEKVNNKYQALWGLVWQFVSWIVRAVVTQMLRFLKALHIETTALVALGLDPAWISNTSLGLDLEDRGALERKENKLLISIIIWRQRWTVCGQACILSFTVTQKFIPGIWSSETHNCMTNCNIMAVAPGKRVCTNT